MTDSDIQSIKDVAVQFETVLGSSDEQVAHTFLETHPELFGFLRDWGMIKSKFRLADAFIPDFVSFGSGPSANDIRPYISFIEIECPTMQLFTKAGDPASGLTHAVRQVQNWKHWVTNNRMYFQQILANILAEEMSKVRKNWLIDQRLRGLQGEYGLPGGFKDRYIVIAGRRNTMTVPDRILLAQMNDDLHGIQIITYDVLLDWLLSMIAGTDKNYPYINAI
ncbi:MAG: DUF4263 domain-containing protein [Acidobacteriota bacterium]|nr:DUF4263 domain-containing protein [Acidobacteriota bacterium]